MAAAKAGLGPFSSWGDEHSCRHAMAAVTCHVRLSAPARITRRLLPSVRPEAALLPLLKRVLPACSSLPDSLRLLPCSASLYVIRRAAKGCFSPQFLT